MNHFSRDFALVRHDGHVIAESHDAIRLEKLCGELVAEGVRCTVVMSDLPRRS